MVATLTPQSGKGEAIADDVAQDTLLTLWQMRDRLNSVSSLRAYAMVIARNRACDILRHDSNLQLTSGEEFDSPSSLMAPDASLQRAEMAEEINQALMAIPYSQQAIIRMRHVEGMEIDDIAAIVGSTPGAIRTALSRARANIKDIFMQRNSL